mgnify:CR=1 FL=1
MSRADEPAYPQSDTIGTDDGTAFGKRLRGLTIRERFVMAAMQGLCADYSNLGMPPTNLACEVILIATATLKELEKANDRP